MSVRTAVAKSEVGSIRENGSVSSRSVSTAAPASTVKLEKNSPRIVRFNVCLIMLLSSSFSLLLSHSLLITDSFFVGILAQIYVLFMSAYLFEWTRVHSRALTRHRRAYFDESNVLETYQPRARTHGHLFTPDPPTPNPAGTVQFSDDTEEKNPSPNAAFMNARDQHYANEFQNALRMAKEMESMGPVACTDTPNPNSELKPADPVADAKRAKEEEKKKKEEMKKKGGMAL